MIEDLRPKGSLRGLAQAARLLRTLRCLSPPPPHPTTTHTHTGQEIHLTQDRINERLGAKLFGKVVLYGQSDITALLEASFLLFVRHLGRCWLGRLCLAWWHDLGTRWHAAVHAADKLTDCQTSQPDKTVINNFPLQASDTDFKKELAKIVDLDVWAAAKEVSRAQLSARRAH